MTKVATDDMAVLTGLTARQVDRYCCAGAFGEANRRPGSGGKRRFSETDVRVGAVLAELARLTGLMLGQSPLLGQSLAAAVAAALHEAPPENKVLLIDIEGVHVQFGHWMTHPGVVVDLERIDDHLKALSVRESIGALGS